MLSVRMNDLKENMEFHRNHRCYSLSHLKRSKMNNRMSREDAACLLSQMHKLTAQDEKSNSYVYSQCQRSSAKTPEFKAVHSEVLHDIIDGLTFKINYFQNIVVENVLGKCATLLSQFMKDYGNLMWAAVKEIQKVVSFLQMGLQRLLSVAVSLTTEKDLYAEKALCLARGFVSSSAHSFDMLTIQPRFGYLDVVSDICFKDGSDVVGVVQELYNFHKSKSDSQMQSYFSGEVAPLSSAASRSTGDNLGYIENCYNQQLLSALSLDVHRAISLIKSKIVSEGNGSNVVGDNLVRAEQQEADEVDALKMSYLTREESALRIHRFVDKYWLRSRKAKKRKINMVYHFLSTAVFRRRAQAQVFKKRRLARCRRVICRAILQYVLGQKLKARSRQIIRSNLRTLFRNFLFRKVAMACRKGAKELVQREWALKNTDVELRLLRIETYLSSSTAAAVAPYRTLRQPMSPLPEHQVLEGGGGWDNLQEFSREELLRCNVHVLNMMMLDEDRAKASSACSTSKCLGVFEDACLLRDVECGARQRVEGGLSRHTESTVFRKGRKVSVSKGGMRRSLAAPSVRDTDKNIRHPPRPGRSLSVKGTTAAQQDAEGGALVQAQDGLRLDLPPAGSSLVSQIDFIMKAL